LGRRSSLLALPSRRILTAFTEVAGGIDGLTSVSKSVIAAALLVGCMAAGTIRAAQEDVKVNHNFAEGRRHGSRFHAARHHWKQIHLSDYRGKKNVFLAFYVLAFTEG